MIDIIGSINALLASRIGLSRLVKANLSPVAKITGKEQLIHDQHTGTGRGGVDKPHYYNPNDEARTTIKQTTIYTQHSGVVAI